ncbi:pyrroloquinoline quinone biosynthesis protein PqqE [Pelomonas aquatica]|jgi:pyrroloquinoline quinone biosynthesis protein E|uniref:PqqA peptide cyclase n=1 Tax=Pelomonas aquatica TaxID=431058 RepID=A0A9X4R9P7_9BURK|nr:pyrroloquinoline quinone biosynthesis protein PqqE [Pelomonas aquatica]MDG0864583.1 pyrroloquinoline quinone biosynthesis protein PqqE [Pelomonas aquatica]
MNAVGSAEGKMVGPPLWLLAELTYRCPLHCVFCSNPLDYARHGNELSTAEWRRVLSEGRAMGAVQLGLSGGEPLLRDDLEEIVAHAHGLGFYVNLITSGIGLTESRARALKEAGLDHIQLSFQDSTRELNDFLSSTRSFDLKAKVAGIIKGLGYPMVLNCVMHRYNLPHVGRIIAMAEAMGADFLELANTQYYGWAWLNREALMPTREDLVHAEAIVDDHRARLAGRMKILWVSPDYQDARPKACMNGWGAVFLLVAPDGAALPCHSARVLPGLDIPFVQDRSLSEIWYESSTFNLYRGSAWLSDTCRSCDQHTHDFGGCRCQAYLITGAADATDPVCPKSPDRPLVDSLIARAGGSSSIVAQPLKFVPNLARQLALVYRTDANSRERCDAEDRAHG